MRLLLSLCLLCLLLSGCATTTAAVKPPPAPAVVVPPGMSPATAKNMQNMPGDIRQRLREQGKIR